MDSKKNTGHKLRSTYYVRDRTYSANTLLIPSRYAKTIVVITPLMKFGGAVALNLIARTTSDVRVVLVTQRCIDVESLRSQLPSYVRSRLIARECELHSPLSIKMAIIWLRMRLGNINMVVHLEPLPEESSSTDIRADMKTLLCANSYSIELFHRELLYYYGTDVPYVEIEFPLTENTANVVRRVLEECFK